MLYGVAIHSGEQGRHVFVHDAYHMVITAKLVNNSNDGNSNDEDTDIGLLCPHAGCFPAEERPYGRRSWGWRQSLPGTLPLHGEQVGKQMLCSGWDTCFV